MRVGIIAEGHADVAIIKSILKKLKGIDGSDVLSIRPKEHKDYTDLNEEHFSNWNLVLNECRNEQTFHKFFDLVDEESFLIIHIDSAERGEKGYDILEPIREKGVDWSEYSNELYTTIKSKIEHDIPVQYRDRVLYAIAIEEIDAWLIPLFETTKVDAARYANPKERLEYLISRLGKKEKQVYIDTGKKSLNYEMICNKFKKELKICRANNKSLNLFCLSVEESILVES